MDLPFPSRGQAACAPTHSAPTAGPDRRLSARVGPSVHGAVGPRSGRAASAGPEAARPGVVRSQPTLMCALWSTAALLLALQVARGVHEGYDLAVIYDAGTRLLHGDAVYADPLFLYLPSSALLAAPFGMLSWPVALVLGAVLGGAAVVWLSVATVRLLMPTAAAWIPLVAVVGIAASAAGAALFDGVNVEFVALAALPVLYRCAADHRWASFGLLLGGTFAVKPILAGLLLLPLLARQWRATGLALAVPVVLSGAALLCMGAPADVLPMVLAHVGGPAQPAFQGADVSIVGIARSFGVSGSPVLACRGSALVLGLVAALLRWRQGGDPALRMTETGTLALLTSIVAGSLAWQHYALLAVPALLLAGHPESLVRRAWGIWPCLVPLLVVVPPLPTAPVAPWSLGSRAGLALLAVLAILSGTVITAARHRRGGGASRTDGRAAAWTGTGTHEAVQDVAAAL